MKVYACIRCNKPMVLRRRKSDQHPFYGCSAYPSCKWTCNVNDHPDDWGDVGVRKPMWGIDPDDPDPSDYDFGGYEPFGW